MSEPVPDPELQQVLRELRDREPVFHRPELGTTRDDLERQTAPDFFEVGASGRRYSRGHVIATLLARYARSESDEWETTDFHCRAVGPETYLLTYLLRQGERRSRRVTAWRRTDGQWQVLYHQGTLVTE
ncbi:nuclear transport factor 2 family protein [Motilibacter deserti]|uniref:DUF4440 domain-containing protein n=1 Tax=Motilibacter deserti TaxID=2714956 RepID=A0ABX0H2P3_9ACTN|nr:DUF4440 domain-containing protein [Motilibacter deserti]NHC15693.1 DUF4440 domain-containing protein [Motilibacter deserti]